MVCRVVCIFFLTHVISVSHSILNALNQEDDSLSSSDSSYSSSSEEEEDDDDVLCTPEKETKSSRTFSTPKSSRRSSVQTPAKTPKKTVRFHLKELFLFFLNQLFECLMSVTEVEYLNFLAFNETLSRFV